VQPAGACPLDCEILIHNAHTRVNDTLIAHSHIRVHVLAQTSATSHEWATSLLGPWSLPEHLESDTYFGGGSADFWVGEHTFDLPSRVPNADKRAYHERDWVSEALN